MKNLLLLLACTILVGKQGFSQIEQITVKFNQLEAIVNSDGNLFHNQSNATAGLSHALDNAAMVFAANLWLAGLKANGQLVTSAGTFNNNGRDFFPNNVNANPIDSLKSYTLVSQDEINEHINNAGSAGYVVPQNITDWPANRTDQDGNLYTAAPFFDVNNNGLYEPELGDYPEIIGSTMLFMIVNDASQQGTVTRDEGLGVDVYISIYAWENSSNNAVDNTLFVNYKIINQSATSYTLYKGLFVDTDLGNSDDDFIGSNEALNTFYTYNGDEVDEDGNGVGFGVNPPVFGGKALCGSLTGLMYYFIGSGPLGDVQIDSDYFNYLNSRWKDNSPLLNKGMGYWMGGEPTQYAFNGDPLTGEGWNEISAQNQPSDRRLVACFNEQASFSPGAEQSFTIAFNYARDKSLGAVQNIGTLYDNFAEVEQFISTISETFPEYWADNFCSTSVGINTHRYQSLTVYPNPAEAYITIKSVEKIQSLKAISTDGKSIALPLESNNRVHVASLNSGLYTLVIEYAGGSFQYSTFSKK